MAITDTESSGTVIQGWLFFHELSKNTLAIVCQEEIKEFLWQEPGPIRKIKGREIAHETFGIVPG